MTITTIDDFFFTKDVQKRSSEHHSRCIVHQTSIAYIPLRCSWPFVKDFKFLLFFTMRVVTNYLNLHFFFKSDFLHQFKLENEETYCIELSRSSPTPFPDPWCSTTDRPHGRPGFCKNSPPSTTTWSCERGVFVTPTADSLFPTLWRSLSRGIRARVSFGNSLPPTHRLEIDINKW